MQIVICKSNGVFARVGARSIASERESCSRMFDDQSIIPYHNTSTLTQQLSASTYQQARRQRHQQMAEIFLTTATPTLQRSNDNDKFPASRVPGGFFSLFLKKKTLKLLFRNWPFQRNGNHDNTPPSIRLFIQLASVMTERVLFFSFFFFCCCNANVLVATNILLRRYF